MKATEFVKKFGWFATTRLVNGIDTTNDPYFTILLDDLKRLVESHELVNRVIKDHNKCFPECQIDLIMLKRFAYGKGGKIYPKKLKQAIADVEACQPQAEF